MEWYTLMDQGKLSKDDKIHVPDIYKQQELLHEEVDAIKRELAECQYMLSETKKIHERIAKERDHHRLHHTRLTQEKQKLADEIKELKKQLLEKEPLKKQAQQKFELLVKERTLMQLERDKLAQRVQTLETMVPLKSESPLENPTEKIFVYEPPAKFQDRRNFLLPTSHPKINLVETNAFMGQLNAMEVSHPHRLHDTVVTT
jgi:chromosome segregation ATPase